MSVVPTQQGLTKWWNSISNLSEISKSNYLTIVRSYLGYRADSGDESAAKTLRWVRNSLKARPKPKPAIGRRQPLSATEFEQYLGYFSGRQRLALEILYRLGLRPSTVLSLGKANLVQDEDGGWLKFLTKGGRELAVPCPQDLYDRLGTLEEPWFEWTRQVLDRRIRGLAKRHFGRPLSARDFRRGFVTRTYAKSNDLFLAAKLAGHASTRTTEIYLTLDRKRMREAVE